MTTPHNEAEKDMIAKVVLMPGDPLRAKYIADTYLKDVIQFNGVRNMFGYTGTYKGTLVSVMGSGMGMPSIGIYSYELYHFYDVQTIIRIGSCGAYASDLHLHDIIITKDCWSESSYARCQGNNIADVQYPDKQLNASIKTVANNLSIPLIEGRIHSSDVFYYEDNVDQFPQFYEKHGCIAVDMECFALFHNAQVAHKKAACLLSVSDSLVNKTAISAKDRETTFAHMMEIALETAIHS